MLDRTVPPPYIQSTNFDLIQPAIKKLPNGVDLFFIRGGSQEVLKIELLFKAGRWVESNWGVSYFTSHLLSKGTRSRSSFEIAQLFDRYGAHLEVSAGLDLVSISLYALSKNLKQVLDLLTEIVQIPVFPEKEIEQSKSIYIQNLKVNLEKTSFLASKAFRKTLFGADHPYGKELEESDVEAIQQEHLESHFFNFFKSVSVFASGNIDIKNEKLVSDVFSAWPTWRPMAIEHKVQNTSPKPSYVYQEKEKSVQSSLRMGCRAVLRTHPDYTNTVFVSHVLGGYFGSRLMKNIREEKGLTYGVYSSIHPLQRDSYLVIGADVNKENVNLTFAEIRKELKKLRSEKISQDELDTARSHFIGSLQSEITTPFAHADKIKTIYLYGLPLDFYKQMISKIKRMDAEQIIETSEKYFNEENLFEIAVG
jgi:zinc protease